MKLYFAFLHFQKYLRKGVFNKGFVVMCSDMQL